MSENINYNINLLLKDNKIVAVINNIQNSFEKVTKAIDQSKIASEKASAAISKSFSMVKLDSLLNNIDRVANGLTNLSNPGLNLSTSMADLQAITGVAGQKLKEIEGYARENAKTFGGSAADGIESFKLILSKLNPEIANTPAALKAMGENVSILSKTMGGDTVAATDVLTTAMNQFQVSTDDPIAASKEMADMMNVMAAAAKVGSAELPQIKQALEQSGLAAKTAGVSFSETNAAIQVLDKAGKKGSEGGVALRNVLATLSEGRFLPKETQKALEQAGVNVNILGDKSLTLEQRLAPLKNIVNDSALVTKLFGKENQNAAIALIESTDQMGKYASAIQGTNTANEQAAIIMNSPAEKAKRIQANIDDLKISIFNATGGMMGYVSVVADVGKTLGDLSPIFSLVGGAFSFLTNTQKLTAFWSNILAIKTKILSYTMYGVPIVWIVMGIIALIAIITYLVMKIDGWGKMWDHTVKSMKYQWEAFKSGFLIIWYAIRNPFLDGVDYMIIAWNKFKDLIGQGDGAQDAINAANQRMADRATEMNAEKANLVFNASNAVKEGLDAWDSLSWNKKSLTDVKNEISNKLGLNNNAQAPNGGARAVTGGGNFNADGKTKNIAAKKAEGIATGGTKNTTIHMRIGNIVEKMSISSASGKFKDAAVQMTEQIEEAIVRALASAAATAG